MSVDTVARLRASGLTKSYEGVTVLDDVDLTIAPGEVRALLGENGAGKSTLIKILSGVVRADAAAIVVDDMAIAIDSPRSATLQGIATLHQELLMVPGLSVAENVFLGRAVPTRFGRIRWRRLEQDARALFERLGHDIDVTADAAKLSPVDRTMTVLARALSYDSRLLILDEPTAALTDAETSLLFGAMRRLRERGVAILYVSHRLDEVLDVCDTFTVLRNGRLVVSGAITETTAEALVTAMAGRPIEAIFPQRSSVPGDVLLEVRGMRGTQVRTLDFDVRAGEVLGIAGLAGSGRSEILRMLAGVQPRAGGVAVLDGVPIASTTVRRAQQRGVALVPQERRAQGLVPGDVERNANLTTVDRHTRLAFVTDRRRSRRHAAALVKRLGLRYRRLDQQVLTLSGGNQQKVVLAKFIALDPRMLLLDEPTRGVDVATKSQIYRFIEDRAADGSAAVVVSSELPELLGLAHRILVMHEGRSAGIFEAATTTEHELLLACYGRTS